MPRFANAYNFTAKPKKSMLYVRILDYINDHPGCTKADIFSDGLGRKPNTYSYNRSINGRIVNTKQYHFTGFSVVLALDCARFIKCVISHNHKGHQCNRYYITNDGFNQLSMAK